MNAITSPGGELRDRPTLGVACFITNLAIMALLSATVRLLLETYPLAQILMFRYLAAMLFFGAILCGTIGLRGLVTRRPLDHLIRSLSGILSLALFYYAVSVIPIADATALAYAAPIFITLLSIFLLGEVIGLQRWIAVIAGFVGVLLIAQPGGAGWNIGVAAATASAFIGAIVAIWLRKLSSSEKSVTIGALYNSFGFLLCLAWMLTTAWTMPLAADWLLIAVFGLLCGVQQWCLTISFRYAEASLLAPFEYLAMVFAAMVGYFFWGEIPVLTTWVGAAVIAASGLFIFLRRQRRLPAGKAADTVVID